MGDFKRLEVWRLAHVLTLEVYRVTRAFPPAERFGLKAQIRRAAISIPSNIAEGGGRTGDRELVRFLRIARGSAAELEYQLLLAQDLGLIDPDTHAGLRADAQRVNRMLLGLIRHLSLSRPK